MKRARDRLRIVVLGYIVRGPLGGLTWHHLQYVMGLAALGHAVTFVEDSDDYPSCYDPSRSVTDSDPTYGLAYAAAVFDRVGLRDCWAYHDAHARRWYGPRAGDVETLCADADLLLNLSGVNPLRPWTTRIPVRALVDTDPVFTQIRHLTEPAAMAMARAHTAFFTFGENLGRPGCGIPDDGLPWIATRQPIVLDAWPASPAPEGGRYTTVMQWESYASREYGGVLFGMKSVSFAPFKELPRRSGPVLELALGGATAPRDELAAAGWSLRDPLEITRDPWTYQDYLRNSRGEFTLAKHGYVVSRSGWFSERSAAYLAMGRPVIVQDTGFSQWLPTGTGVVAFSDPDSACGAIADVESRYPAHCEAARDIAAACFDARRILPGLVERAFRPSPHCAEPPR